MANCLVTKLKESVQNDNLPIFNFLNFKSSTAFEAAFSPVSGKTITVKDANGGSTSLSARGTIQCSADLRYYVGELSNIEELDLYYGNIIGTPESLIGCTNLRKFFYGGILDAKYLPDIELVTTIEITTSTIIGDLISWLKKQKNANGILITNSTGFSLTTSDCAGLSENIVSPTYNFFGCLEGRLEDFVIKRKIKYPNGSAIFGRYTYNTGKVSFNGDFISSTDTTYSLSWAANSSNPAHTDITLDGITITVDENGDVVD